MIGQKKYDNRTKRPWDTYKGEKREKRASTRSVGFGERTIGGKKNVAQECGRAHGKKKDFNAK